MNNIFVLSLFWSITSEIECNHSQKIQLIKLLFKFLSDHNYCILPFIDKFTEDDQSIYESLSNKYKLCFQNSINIDYYLQNGRYDNEFTEMAKLGKGGFGSVYKVHNKFDLKHYAMKKVIIKEFTNNSIEQTLKEIKVWSNIDNQFIVQYKTAWFELILNSNYDSDDSDDYESSNTKRDIIVLHIQMELCDTTLKELSKQLNIELNQNEKTGLSSVGYYIVFQIFLEIIEGISYMHTQKPPLIHRDIKLSNILIKSHSGNKKFVKICDFGLTTYHNRSSNTHTQGVGSPEYIAPEVYKGRVYNEKSDIYSIGVVMSKLFLLTTNRAKQIINLLKPNTNQEKNIRNTSIKLAKQLECPKIIVNAFCNVILLQNEWPEERPASSVILKNSNCYCISYDKVKTSPELTEIYFKWYRNEFSESETLNQLLFSYLKTNLFHKALNKSENKILNQISILGNYFKTNLTDQKLVTYLTKILIHGLNISESAKKLKIFVENTTHLWKCIIVKCEIKTVYHLIESFNKHKIDYYVYYDTSNERLFMLLSTIQFFLVNFIVQKYQKNSSKVLKNLKTLNSFSYSFLYEIESNEHLIDLTFVLKSSEILDNTILFNCDHINSYRYFLKQSKFIYFNNNETYVCKNDGKFYLLNNSSNTFSKLIELNKTDITSIVNNASHKIVLTLNGLIYLWGHNNHGQLGNGTTNSEDIPTVNYKLRDKKFTKICCGDFFTVALDDSGKLYAWGRNNYGQVGCGGNYNQFSPIQLLTLNHENIIDISCGTQHSLALTLNGKLYSWGNNYYNQLGIGDKNKRIIPTLISTEAFDNELIIKVECNKHESFVLTCNGNVYKTDGEIVFKILNDKTDKFLDISLNQTELLVALSSNGFCYVYGVIENNVEHRKHMPILMKTPLISIQNCFFVFTKSQYTYKPVLLNNSEVNVEYKEYKLLQSLELSKTIITNPAIRSEQFTPELIDIVENVIKRAVSFHSIKLVVEECTPFRCYVMNSTKQTVDNFISIWNDNKFNYLLIRDRDNEIAILLLDYIYFRLIDYCFEKCELSFNIKHIDSFRLKDFTKYYVNRKLETINNLNLTNWRVLRKLPQKTRNSIQLFSINYNKVFYVTKDDMVFSFGDNNNSCLGLGYENEFVSEPSVMDELCHKNVVKFVFASEYMAALTDKGHVFSWGDNYRGRLGHKNESKCLKPSLIRDTVELDVKDIYCCTNCLIILTKTNDVFKVQSNKLNRFCFHEFQSNEMVMLCRAKDEHLFVFTDQFIYIYYEKGFQRVSPNFIKYDIREYKPKSFAYINCNSSDNFKCYFLSMDGNIYEFSTENQLQNKQDIRVLNDKNHKFDDICYSKFTQTFVALSSSGNCFIMNNNIKSLTETPVLSIENALSIYCEPQITSQTILI